MDVETLAIIAVSGAVAVMVLSTLGLIAYMIIRALKSGGSRKSGGESIEETRMIQEIYHGLERMDRRVESLETLMMDEDRSRRETMDGPPRNR